MSHSFSDNSEAGSPEYEAQFSSQQFRRILKYSPPPPKYVSPETSTDEEASDDLVINDSPDHSPRHFSQLTQDVLQNSPGSVDVTPDTSSDEERKEQGYSSGYSDFDSDVDIDSLLRFDEIPPATSRDDEIPESEINRKRLKLSNNVGNFMESEHKSKSDKLEVDSNDNRSSELYEKCMKKPIMQEIIVKRKVNSKMQSPEDADELSAKGSLKRKFDARNSPQKKN